MVLLCFCCCFLHVLPKHTISPSLKPRQQGRKALPGMLYNFYHHPLDDHARPGLCQTPGSALMRKERDMVTVCLSGSYGWGFEIGHWDGKHQMGAQKGGGGIRLFNTPRTLCLGSSQDIGLLKFSFRCLVLRGSAQCQLLSPFFSPPLPQRNCEFLLQMLDYINFNTGSSPWLNC